ncbi:hypothetical protein DL98DRAFT_579878 [Cadophora sp. DSE1049]|nr:hypothetical protein DL98DRAFT_579878 [Cadophora sp. DSE1049]
MSDDHASDKIYHVTSTGSESNKTAHTTKAERHRRKKENAKKAKAEARLKAEEESRLLDEMAALTVKAKAEQEARKPTEQSCAATDLNNGSTTQDNIPFLSPGLLFKFDLSTEKGGIGAFAVQNIKNSTEILVEEAIMKGTNEHICKEALFSVLSEEKKTRVVALQSLCSCKVKPCTETPLTHVLEVNSYETPSGPALYELAARFNHDCLPNIARGFSKEGFLIFCAGRDIKQGEELTVNYTMIPGSTKTRRGYLLEKFDFLCKCHGCKNNMVYTESDIAKAKLPERVEPETPAIGRYTSEEFAAYTDVEAWFGDVKKGMVTIQRAQYDYMAKQVVAKNPRVLDRKGRGVLAKRTLAFINQYLKLNNKFGLENAVFDSFQARNAEHMIEATERNYGLIMDGLEKSKT